MKLLKVTFGAIFSVLKIFNDYYVKCEKNCLIKSYDSGKV